VEADSTPKVFIEGETGFLSPPRTSLHHTYRTRAPAHSLDNPHQAQQVAAQAVARGCREATRTEPGFQEARGYGPLQSKT